MYKGGISKECLTEYWKTVKFNLFLKKPVQFRSSYIDFDTGIKIDGVLFECQKCQKQFNLSQRQVDLSVGDVLTQAHNLYHRALQQEELINGQTR